jgi:hypothetical protein
LLRILWTMASHAGRSLLGSRGIGTGPAAVHGVADYLQPPVEQLRGERIAVVEVAVVLDGGWSPIRATPL